MLTKESSLGSMGERNKSVEKTGLLPSVEKLGTITEVDCTKRINVDHYHAPRG